MRRNLAIWVGAQLVLPVFLLLPGVSGPLLTRLPDVHASIKGVLITWQSLLLRAPVLVVLVAAVGFGVLPRLGRYAAPAAAVLALVVAFLLRSTLLGVPLVTTLFVVNFLPVPRKILWVPGAPLVLPVRILDALGFGGAYAALAGAWLSTAWIVGDTLLGFDRYEAELFAPWPTSRVDPRVTTVANAPEGVKCDFHDVDVLADRVVVTAEGQARLLSIPKDGGETSSWRLAPQWGRSMGLTMDSETVGDRTYFLAGPHNVVAVDWASGWTQAATSPAISQELHHVYTAWIPERERLSVLTIGTQNMAHVPTLLEFSADLSAMRQAVLRLPDGSRPPTIRDFAWVPTTRRFVLAPDFGDRLYVLDPDSGVVTPWLSVPALDGRVTWVDGLSRILLPLPNRAQIWLIDPATGGVETIPTQPGVRTAAIDVERGLLVTASLLTGRVLVQRLDGSIVDSFGTLMPMVRNLALDPARGEAWLSTWTALYRIPYARLAG